MEYRIPKKGEIYRHFKGNLYEIVLIARDSETLEEKVVYKEIDGDSAYVRALPMFVSPVDKEKYPEVKQEFRFELVKHPVLKPDLEEEGQLENLNREGAIALQEQKMILEFLDLSAAKDKLYYLQSVKNEITENFIGIVANALDFTENEGSLPERYAAIVRFLHTKMKYETGRLR